MLTRKKELFCKIYLANGFNGSDAARKAGYKSVNDNYYSKKASRLLKEEEVKAYIEMHKEKVNNELDQKIIVTQKELLEYLSRCVNGTETEEVVVTTKEWYDKIELKIKQADRLKAAQMIFKYYSLDDASKKENQEEDKVIINNDIQPMPEEEEIKPINEEVEEAENEEC